MTEPVNSKSLDTSSADAATVPGVGLLHKTFALLDLFTPERPEWSQADLARETELPRSTASRLVRYLSARGYLAQDGASRTYTLGPAAADLGRRAVGRADLADRARDVLEDISRETRETVLLTRFHPGERSVVCVQQVPSLHEGLQVFEKLGARFPLTAGASAKAVLAALPERERQDILETLGAEDAARLLQDIDAIRRCGYAVSQGETYPGAGGMGVPILGPGRRPLGSLAVAAPLYRMTDAAKQRFATLLLEGAGRISYRLGGPGTLGEAGLEGSS